MSGDEGFGAPDGRLTRRERAAWDGMAYGDGSRIERGDRVLCLGVRYRVLGYDLLRGRVLALGPGGTALLDPADIERVE